MAQSKVDSSVCADTMPPIPATAQCILQQKTRASMKKHAIDIGLKFIKTKYGRFLFNIVDSLQELKHACNSEKIKDFLQLLFLETGVANSLGFGNFIFHFSIFAQDTEHLEKAKAEIWRLFEKELDPDRLFEDFKRRKLVGEEEKDKVMHCFPGKKRMAFLLGRLVQEKETDEGFEILMDHCKNHNYEIILNKYAEIGDGRMLYTAEVTSSVCMKESTGAVQGNPVPESELYSISVHIENSMSYFDTYAGDADGNESSANVCKEIAMKLIPAWDTTKEKTTVRGDLDVAAPRVITSQMHHEDDGSHQSLSAPDSDRLESSELDQTVSQHGENSSYHSDISLAAGINTDASHNDLHEAIKEEIELKPDLKPTEEKDITKELLVEDEGYHQSLSTLASNRLESSELDQTSVSQHGEKSSCHSDFTPDDLAHAADIDTDKSLRSGQELCASEAGSSIKPSTISQTPKQHCKRKKVKPNTAKQRWKRKKVMPSAGNHRQVLNRCIPDLVRDLEFKNVSLHIQKKELFDDVIMRNIREQGTTSDKITELIEHIKQRDQDTYSKFKECLVLADQSFLKDKLEEEEAKLALEGKASSS